MKTGIFLAGLFLGIALTFLALKSIPRDNESLWKRADNLEGKIVIIIGNNPKAEHPYESWGIFQLHKGKEDGRWDEFCVVQFETRQDALKARDKILNNLEKRGDASSNINGK